MCCPASFVTVADAQHPYVLQYEHGFLETYTFGVTLGSDGTLTSINSQSTPDQGKTIANLASAAGSIAGVAKQMQMRQVFPTNKPAVPAPSATLPDCTQSPIPIGYEKVPTDQEILKYRTTPIPQ